MDLFTTILLSLVANVIGFVLPDLSFPVEGADASNLQVHLQASTVIAAVISIIAGLLLVFAGYKLTKAALFVAGFYLFAAIAQLILVRANTGISTNAWAVFGVSCAAGILGGLLAMWLFRAGLALLGGAAGVALACFILSVSPRMFSERWQADIFILVFFIVGAIAVAIIAKPALIVCTAFFGSFLFMLGIDLLSPHGFTEAYRQLIYGHQFDFNAIGKNPVLIAELVSILVLTLAGIVVQTKTTSHNKKHPKQQQQQQQQQGPAPPPAKNHVF